MWRFDKTFEQNPFSTKLQGESYSHPADECDVSSVSVCWRSFLTTLTLKKPMTATSLSAMSDSACVTSPSVVAAGPVFFFNQFRMSSACRPATHTHTRDQTETSIATFTTTKLILFPEQFTQQCFISLTPQLFTIFTFGSEEYVVSYSVQQNPGRCNSSDDKPE